MTLKIGLFGLAWMLALILAYSMGRNATLEAGEESEGRSTDANRRGTLVVSGRAEFEAKLEFVEDPEVHDELFEHAEKWARSSPEEAVKWLGELEFDDPRNPFLFSALTQWAEQDASAASKWLNQKYSEGHLSMNYLLAAMVRGLSRQDPDVAKSMLLSSPKSPERSGAVDFLVRAWYRKGIEHAAEELKSLGDLKERALKELFLNVSSEDLEKAVSLSEGLPFEDRLIAQASLAANWGRRDPAAAAKWAGGLDGHVVRERALGEVATRWARLDPVAAGQWLDENAGRSEMDLAMRSYAGNTVNYDPALAFAKVSRITSQSLRDQSFEQIGRIFLNHQPQRAKAYFENDTVIPAVVRETLLRSFE